MKIVPEARRECTLISLAVLLPDPPRRTATTRLLAAASASTAKTKTKKKKKGTSVNKSTPTPRNTARPVGPGRSISQEELSLHVNACYEEGRSVASSLAASSEAATSAETQEYLRQLNSRPSLVLNADYQVCKKRERRCTSVVQNAPETNIQIKNVFFSPRFRIATLLRRLL